jgi:lipopolysaccharide export system protein LptA
MKYRKLFFLLLFFLIIFSPSFDALSAKDEIKNNGPVNVTSNSMFAKEKDSTVEFKGNVVVTSEDSIIHADIITMFFTKETEKNKKKTEKQNSKIKKIIALGNVEYFSGERKAFADKAVYTYEDEVLVLTGDMPKVITGKNSVTGKKITLFQKNGKIIIEGEVNAVFVPDEDSKQKND